MKIQFLGTGAADWKNDYDTKHDLRHTSSVLVNDSILIDPTPEVVPYTKRILKADLSKISAILVTHTHVDHWNAESMRRILDGCQGTVDLYFHASAKGNLNLPEECLNRLALHSMKRGATYRVNGLKVVCLEANHQIQNRETGSHFILTEASGKEPVSWFYGCDGGWFLNRTWDYLRKSKLDGVILDATVGEYPYNFRIGSHNTLPMVRLLTGALKEQGIMKENGKVVLSHFSKEMHPSLKETKKNLQKEGLIMAYDGMTIEDEGGTK